MFDLNMKHDMLDSDIDTDLRFVKFPSIGHLKNLRKKLPYVWLPDSITQQGNSEVWYEGTVKLHGQNCAIVSRPEEELQYQSRNLILDGTKGFARFCIDRNPVIDNLISEVRRRSGGKTVAIFGEYCGPGIQKGVGISQQPDKFFVIFGVKVDSDWQRPEIWREFRSTEYKIYNIRDFEIFEIKINFTNPEASIAVTQELAERVGRDCPVARVLGTPGKGEGIVFQPKYDEKNMFSSRLWFKAKCDDHSCTRPTNPKIQKKNDDQEQINDFIESNLNQNRLDNCLETMLERNYHLDKNNTGIFLKILVEDIIDEEGQNIENKLVKAVKKSISEKGKIWYWSKCKEHI